MQMMQWPMPYQQATQQWEQSQVLTTHLAPSIGAIVPVVTLEGWQNALQKSRPVDTNIRYTENGYPLSVSVGWGNKIKFICGANMTDFC